MLRKLPPNIDVVIALIQQHHNDRYITPDILRSKCRCGPEELNALLNGGFLGEPEVGNRLVVTEKTIEYEPSQKSQELRYCIGALQRWGPDSLICQKYTTGL